MRNVVVSAVPGSDQALGPTQQNFLDGCGCLYFVDEDTVIQRNQSPLQYHTTSRLHGWASPDCKSHALLYHIPGVSGSRKPLSPPQCTGHYCLHLDSTGSRCSVSPPEGILWGSLHCVLGLWDRTSQNVMGMPQTAESITEEKTGRMLSCSSADFFQLLC